MKTMQEIIDYLMKQDDIIVIDYSKEYEPFGLVYYKAVRLKENLRNLYTKYKYEERIMDTKEDLMQDELRRNSYEAITEYLQNSEEMGDIVELIETLKHKAVIYGWVIDSKELVRLLKEIL